MTRAILLLAIAACSGIPGDPDTLVVDGEPAAGYAWSGPTSWCCDQQVQRHAAWQIWFTNTELCPVSFADTIAELVIVSPEIVEQPSTALPALTTTQLQLTTESIADWTAPFAMFYLKHGYTQGTLTLTTYTADEMTGAISASTHDLDGKMLTIRSSFDAHRCDRIHD